MIMFLMAFVLAFFIVFAFVLPMTIRWYWKCVLAVLIFAGAFKNQILYKLGGPFFFAPNLPVWILYFSAWYYAVTFFLFAFLIFSWCGYTIFLLYAVICKKERQWMKWRTTCNRINMYLACAALLLSPWCLYEGARLPEVKKVTIKIKNLPDTANGTTIAVLTDLHVDKMTPEWKLPTIVEMCNTLNPDLIVLLGDLADGPVSRIGKKLIPLKQLHAKYGCYGVPGNHEYYSGYQAWIRHISTLNIRFLLNDAVCLPNGLWIAGTTDSAAIRRNETPPMPDEAARKIPKGDAAVLLAHNPKVNSETHGQYALQLSGHTHGGMIIGLDYLIGLMNDGMVSGLYQTPNGQVYISNGTAIWQGFPLRLFCPPEITLIRLSR